MCLAIDQSPAVPFKWYEQIFASKYTSNESYIGCAGHLPIIMPIYGKFTQCCQVLTKHFISRCHRSHEYQSTALSERKLPASLKKTCRQTSNISHTKSQNLNVSGNAPTTFELSTIYCLLRWLILEVWQYAIADVIVVWRMQWGQ